MANDTNKNPSPARRIEDHLPTEKIDWTKPGAPAVPKSGAAGAASQGGNTKEAEPAAWMATDPATGVAYFTDDEAVAFKWPNGTARPLFDHPTPPLTAPAPLTDELPAILFDSHAVYKDVVAHDPFTHPTSDHVSDVLDAVVRLMRAERGSAAAQGDKHLPGWERGIATVTLSGHQLRMALDLINPDGPSDDLQMSDELTFGIVQHKDDEGKITTGMCCWNGDTDGVLPLDGEYEAEAAPAPQQPDELRKAVRQMARALADGEWADLLTTDPDAAALEHQIEVLVRQHNLFASWAKAAPQQSELTDERLAELFEQATTYPPADEDYAGIRMFATLIEREVANKAAPAAPVQTELSGDTIDTIAINAGIEVGGMFKDIPITSLSKYARAVLKLAPVAAPVQAEQAGWRESLTEMAQAMRDYQMEVDGPATDKHRAMMRRAEALLLAPAVAVQAEQAQVEPVPKSVLDTLWQRVTDAGEAAYTFGDTCKEAVEIALDGVLDMLVQADLALPAQAEQAAAVRAAALEEAAEAVEKLAESSGDAAAYGHREPYPHEVEREFAIEVCANTIRALAKEAAIEAPSQWISVEDRLPDLHVTVALLDENRWMNTGSSDHNVNWHGAGYLCEFGQKYWSIFGEMRSQCLEAVTHWMPLPAAPTVEQIAQGDTGGEARATSAGGESRGVTGIEIEDDCGDTEI